MGEGTEPCWPDSPPRLPWLCSPILYHHWSNTNLQGSLTLRAAWSCLPAWKWAGAAFCWWRSTGGWEREFLLPLLLGFASPAPKLHPPGNTRNAQGAASATALPWHCGVAPWLCDSPGTWLGFLGDTGLSETVLGISSGRINKCEETAQITWYYKWKNTSKLICTDDFHLFLITNCPWTRPTLSNALF